MSDREVYLVKRRSRGIAHPRFTLHASRELQREDYTK